jgi:hypothetical protein
VLVHVGGVDQDGESGSERVVASKVGLQILDACPVVAVDTPQHGVEPLRRRGPFCVDRELVSVVGLSAVEEDQLPYEVVERGPQVVNDLTDQQRPRRVRILADEDPLDAPGPLSLHLANEIRSPAHVGLDGGIEGLQVLVCTVEAKAWAG